MRRPWLLPLVPVYGAVIGLKRRLFAADGRWLEWPVISVGSLSAGGAGKTPVVAALVELLQPNGYGVDILSRGYGRRSDAVERVDPEGSAERSGDEPLELARRTGAAVYVGADRYEAGLLAESETAGARRVHVLDDGFQHRRLGRALDVVLLTGEDVADSLLPAGNLREPLRRLRGADVVVVRQEEEAALRPVVARLAGDLPVWVIARRLEVPTGVASRPLAFCGLARPEGFWGMLRDAGVMPTATVAFRDHHVLRHRDLARLIGLARQSGADGFITTAKDAVKLTALMRRRLAEVGPLVVAGLTVTFSDEAAVMELIVAAQANAGGRVRR
jgi:tetraacyldisaccharide 4'-kinase